VTTYPHRLHVHRRHVNPWLVAVLVLGAAVIGLGAWVVVDQTTSSSRQDLASSEVTAMLDARVAAMNRALSTSRSPSSSLSDAKAIAAFYSNDAVMEEIEAGVPRIMSKGHGQIVDRFKLMIDAAQGSGIQLRTGTTTQIGPYVAQTNNFGSRGVIDGEGILVFRLDKSGKIAHEWVIIGAP
jgi:hypothetical protein